MKATRREVLAGLLGCAACGAGGPAGSRGLRGDASPDCQTTSDGGAERYCLVSALRVRVPQGTLLGVGEALLFNVDDATAVILVRDERGLYARSAICTHACCVVALCGEADCASLTPTPDTCQTTPIVRPGAESGGVVCPCHGSVFRLSDGVALSGPAKTALPAYAVSVEGEDVWVDTAERVATSERV